MFATDIALFRIGDAYEVEYWRFLLPSKSVNFCHNLGYAEILLPSLIGYDGTINWSIEPDGPSGMGNPIVFNPSELAPGAYEVAIEIDTLEGTLEKTITRRRRFSTYASSGVQMAPSSYSDDQGLLLQHHRVRAAPEFIPS